MIFGKFRRAPDPKEAMRPLYAALIAEARAPAWYVEGGVADTLDGRFDMLAAVVSVALARLEREDGDAAVRLTELFIDDMDGQLREQGVGDVGIGKQVGRLLSALGGRLGAYRDALAGEGLEEALVRNLYRGAPPSPKALSFTASHLRGLSDRMAGGALDSLRGLGG